MRIFGVSFATIALIVGVAVVARMWGSKIPGLNMLKAA